jgi:hypothetical protein
VKHRSRLWYFVVTNSRMAPIPYNSARCRSLAETSLGREMKARNVHQWEAIKDRAEVWVGILGWSERRYVGQASRRKRKGASWAGSLAEIS